MATEAPAYEKLVEMLDARFTKDELNALFEEGAGAHPDDFLKLVLADPLFAPA